MAHDMINCLIEIIVCGNSGGLSLIANVQLSDFPENL